MFFLNLWLCIFKRIIRGYPDEFATYKSSTFYLVMKRRKSTCGFNLDETSGGSYHNTSD